MSGGQSHSQVGVSQSQVGVAHSHVGVAHSQVEVLSSRSLGSLIQPSLTHVYRGDIYTSVYVLGCVFLV